MCNNNCSCKPEKKPHVHAELIKAWADGAEIQVKFYGDEAWVDTLYPFWCVDHKYRVKPEPKKYRVALFKSGELGTTNSKETEDYWESHKNFSRWLTDWTPYEE